MVKKSVQIQSGKPTSFASSSAHSSSSWGNADEEYEEDLKVFSSSEDDEDDDPNVGSRGGSINRREREARAADRLSMRLLAIHDDDSDEEDRILRKSLRLLAPTYEGDEDEDSDEAASFSKDAARRKSLEQSIRFERESAEKRQRVICTLVLWAIVGLSIVVAGLWYVGRLVVRPPSQPVGPYALVERQEGENFFPYYSFYEGPDSVGSNGYLNYVSRDHAERREILNVTFEYDDLDDLFHPPQRDRSSSSSSSRNPRRYRTTTHSNTTTTTRSKKPFVYMGTAPTEAGPRDSIRLEGTRRFNRGLFIIDVRHMPAGCGVWPAFWLTDEANWPINGEIDIVEGVNYQNVAKTALHSTKGCSMVDIPLGTMTGGWDTAQGIPDAKTGVPDMTLRYARNCFVYDPHQWLNQGCVAVDMDGDSLGQPLNDNGGGVYALEWDPVNRHIRTWVFTPHTEVPDNLIDAIATAGLEDEDEKIMPDPELWPTPYGYFAVGEGTDCPASHFRQMRLVFNTAFCGSVAGNRFQMDCPAQAKQFDTCNEYIKSDPDEMSEAYWKLRGVFVYEREWERTWLN